MNNQQKQQVTEQVKAANNVLVAVSSNPTVDELAASVGLTLALNKLGKHATTVFSGVVPSTIEFLQPEKTIETTTDSLRDFIIALDKSKADKLRYKVEDDVVRIFITPYRTSITDKDLEFSQGDFNVDVVLALGVTRQEDLDKAITAHGRILHDATVISISNRDIPNELGAMNWQDTQASSLCEMVSSLTIEILPEGMDGQMATALLTGIIAETDRFKNEKTTPLALSLSSQLMSAGANQQLIAEKLDAPEPAPEPEHIVDARNNPEAQESADGTLEIDHESDEVDKIHIDEHGNLGLHDEEEKPTEEAELPPVETPQEDSTQTDNFAQEPTENPSDAFFGSPEGDSEDIEKPSLDQPDSSDTPMMAHQKVIMPPVRDGDVLKTDKPFDLTEAMSTEATSSQYVETPVPPMPPEEVSVPEPEQPMVESAQVPEPIEESTVEPIPEPQIELPAPIIEDKPEPVPEPTPPADDSLAELERAIGSPHASASLAPVEPIIEEPVQVPEPPQVPEPETPEVPKEPVVELPQVENIVEPANLEPPTVDSPKVDVKIDPNAPPAVPPPMTPQFYDSDGNNANPFLNPHQ
jgi:hypothetical protein